MPGIVAITKPNAKVESPYLERLEKEEYRDLHVSFSFDIRYKPEPCYFTKTQYPFTGLS